MQTADFIGCHHHSFLNRYGVLDKIVVRFFVQEN